MSDGSTGRLERLGAWSSQLAAPTFEVGRWQGGQADEAGVIQMPWFEFGSDAEGFLETVRRDGWIQVFEWPAWIEEPANRVLLAEPDRIAAASEDDLSRLLTVIVRGDRFSEGTIADAFERGVMAAIVARAAVLSGPLALE